MTSAQVALIAFVVSAGITSALAADGIGPSVSDYASIHEAIAANPGRVIYVPAGDHVISKKIALSTDGCGLFGHGRIIQSNVEEPIIEIEHAADVRLNDLTLTRSEGAQETRCEAVLAIYCRNLALNDLRVVDNRSNAGAISLRECSMARVCGCSVLNYSRIAVDDRTRGDLYGYAFHCIDGSGIVVQYSKGTLIEGNRVVEQHLLPTPEVQQRYDLGKFAKKNPVKGTLTNQKVWDDERVNNWHQGSAIVVTAPEVSDHTQILGNTIENAAQGIDLHVDQVIVANNIVNNAFIGMKAMHGSRHVLIVGNQFSKNDLWAIGLMPGTASHAAEAATSNTSARGANHDGGSVIANNIISDFGYGNARWIWREANSFPIRFDTSVTGSPPLEDVIVQSNIVYNTGKDGAIVDGKVTIEPPRYKYAVLLPMGDGAPRGIHFSGNLLHPGTDGVSNVELPH